MLTGKEVNVSFSLTLSLEDAIALLSRSSDKKVASLHLVDSTKKANPPKRQTTQNGERVPTFKKVPIPTLKRVLSTLSGQYGDGIFRYCDALAVAVKSGLGRTLVGYALQYAIQQGEIRKVSLGKYTFKVRTKYEPVQDGLIDIITPDAGRFFSTLKLMARVSQNVKLYFGESGLTARFYSQNNSGMLDVRIAKDAFEVYHIKQHVRLTISCKQLIKVLSRKTGDFHILLKEKGSAYSAGYLGNEHILNANDCAVQESPYEVEMPLDSKTDSIPHSMIELPRALLQDILKDVGIHSEVVRILCKGNKAVFDSSFDSNGYSKELVHNGQEIKIQPAAGEDEMNACFELSSIVPMVKEKLSESDSVTLRVSKAAMIMQLLNERGFKMQYYVGPCKIEEAHGPEEKVLPSSFRQLQEDIAELKNDLDSIKPAEN